MFKKVVQNKKSFNEALVDTGIDTASRVGSISLSAGVGSIIIGTLSGGPYGYIAGKFVGGILGLYPGRKISTIIKYILIKLRKVWFPFLHKCLHSF